MSRLRLVIALALVFGCLPGVAQASETAKLKVAFSPNRLGVNTTIEIGMDITNTNGGAPSPVTGFAMHLPPALELIGSTLGLAICNPTVLLNVGLGGCSPNARLGSGTAHVVLPVGPDLVGETASIQILMGPPPHEQIGVLLYAEAQAPVYGQFIFPGVLFTGSSSTGEILDTTIPLIPTLPGAADASVTSMRLSIGPNHLTYYEMIHGKRVGYRPTGIAIPAKCPPGAFPFVADLTFQDGTALKLTDSVHCPSRAGRHRR
jgi:hypothetical protein